VRTALALLARGLGKTERRVVLAIFITAMIPLIAQLVVGRVLIARISATAFQPEFGAHIERSLDVYADLARAIKQGMRAEAQTIAEQLRGQGVPLAAQLDRAVTEHPLLVSLVVTSEDGATVAQRSRARPVDTNTERTLSITLPIAETAADAPLTMTAVFATPRARFDELEGMQSFTQAYRQLEQKHRVEYLDNTYQRLFLAILAVTLGLAIGAGVLLVRPITRRIARLAAATAPVAAGDLSARFPESGDDEVGELGRAFNRMLGELDQSRARIEFLRRMTEWQNVARRLAHEIKNPLTPIQLAVEECHRRYTGDDPEYQRLVRTTLEIVEEEVASLRRLVGEFSSFARLPRAELVRMDLGDVLRDQRGLREDAGADTSSAVVRFELSDEPMPALLDREMLHRVLTNVVLNAEEAIRGASGTPERGAGRVVVSSATALDEYVVDIDDDGPGIPESIRERIFDPYVTTKREGTGLGLSIVKKIVVDHGGTIDALASPLGGARFRIHIPRADSRAARAAAERTRASEQDASLR
jgi:nitrogen fixation/metabolism regulation signal transduction histidine kinase